MVAAKWFRRAKLFCHHERREAPFERLLPALTRFARENIKNAHSRLRRSFALNRSLTTGSLADACHPAAG